MINAIHIEDEPRNIELLKSLISVHCADKINLIGNAQNVKDAIHLIKKTNPQLVYLDIELNQGNAFELLDKLGQFNFQIIFITAYENYALKAFRLNAIDYLLKPISIKELIEASDRAALKIENQSDNANVLNLLKQLKSNIYLPKIGLPVKDGLLFIQVEDIVKVEAKGSYSILYFANGKSITSLKNLSEIENLLPENSFIRPHNSWIIHVKYLKKYFRGKNSYMEMEDGSTVPVSIRKKGEFLDYFYYKK